MMYFGQSLKPGSLPITSLLPFNHGDYSLISSASYCQSSRAKNHSLWRHNCDSNADYQKVGHLSRVLR